MSKHWIFLGSVLLVFSLIGCGQSSETVETATGYVPGQVEEAYGFTHGGYVGQAVVKVLDDGKLDVALDEAFLPHTLAIVNVEGEWNNDNTVYYMSRGNEVRVAKYVEYTAKVYVGVTVGGSLTYVEADEAGNPAGGTDLEKQILRNQGTMKAYYGIIRAGGFKVIPVFGGPAVSVTTTRYGGVTKTASPEYWNSGQTWAGNMAAMEEFIEANGTAYSLDEMKRAEKEDSAGLKKWSVADAVTGATNSDFKDYFGLAQLAAGRLKMQ